MRSSASWFAARCPTGVVSVTCGIYHNVLRHLVPLVITDEELEEGLDVLTDAALAARSG